RLIGDPVTRYQEDPVRMLRSIRFMAKLDMFLDKPSETPIRELAHLLKNIPPARLYDESLKLLQAGYGVKTYRLLREYGLFEKLFPALMPYFTANEDSFAERIILTALTSTDQRVVDKLRINPAFLFAVFFWYPLREKVETLKNEGGLNNHDAYALASNEILDLFCTALAAPRRHTTVIRDIWFLQLQLHKRNGSAPEKTMEHPKFRAAFDLLVMRAEIEGGDTVELATWWHEYQFSNSEQRETLLKEQALRYPKPKKKFYRSRKRRKPKAVE
ncbi:MAG TPA: poly(A) polymerase, partial [Pasteurellaceae bacterium]|nr:poly(A) polymerase [Pasteurellaceae bacterium]